MLHSFDPAKVQRALVIKLRHHGDVLLASPVVSVLKRALPGAEIDALVYADTAAMLDLHPDLAQLHRVDRAWKASGLATQISEEWRLLSRLRARRYDLIVHLTEHWRGAWITRATAARWSVAPAVKGRRKAWRNSFTHCYPKPLAGGRHTVERNLDALRKLGLQIPVDARALTLIPGAQAEQRVTNLLAAHDLNEQDFIQIHPTSRWLFKTWPATRVAHLLDQLAAAGHRLVLTAAPDPAELAFIGEILAATSTSVVNLAGQLSLKDMAALSARARLFVGVDSAPMHIAAAMATPVVGIFGPSGEIEWHPWCANHRVVANNDFPCRPCGIDGCGGGKISECLTTLTVDRVLLVCEELMEQVPRS